MRTVLSGVDAPTPREGSTSAADHLKAARVAALVGSPFVIYGFGGLVFILTQGSAFAIPQLVGAMGAALVLGAGLALAAKKARFERPALLIGAAASATLFLALAVGGHLVHERGTNLRFLFPSSFSPAPAALAWTLSLIVAPLLAGLVTRGAGAALDTPGARAWRPRVRHGGDVILGMAQGWVLPGLALVDGVLTTIERIGLRVRGETRARWHLDIDDARLVEAATDAGYEADTEKPHDITFVKAAEEGRLEDLSVRVHRRRLAFPSAGAAYALDLTGIAADVNAFRREVEPRALFRGLWCWSAPARRQEAQLNALPASTADARSLEDRAALVDQAERIATVARHRTYISDDARVLLDQKLPRLQAALDALQDAPHSGIQERRRGPPAPALAPRLSRILDAGGLDVSERLVYVPHHIVPVRTRDGDVEVVVNALTERVDAGESRDLLRALLETPPTLHAEGTRPTFAEAPRPTAALVGEVREAVRRSRGGRTHADLATIETFLVPFAQTEDGWMDAVTGRIVDDLADSLGTHVPVGA